MMVITTQPFSYYLWLPLMLIDIALLMLAFLLAIPAITGYFAYSHGRSFWLWFAIGCCLPVVANFILAIVCRKEVLRAQKRKQVPLTRYEEEAMRQEIEATLTHRIKQRDAS